MWFSQIINCILLPAILVFMLQLINDKELMGTFKNSWWVNSIAYAGTAILIVLNVILLSQTVKDIVIRW